MPIIYNVTIESTEKENCFQVTWQNPETKTQDCFTQESDITLEEIKRLWQWPQCQLAIGRKLFRFLDGEAHRFQQALNQAHHMGETLQVNLWTCKQTADWPFELLAKDNTFLLSQQLHLVRMVSDWGTEKKIPPQNHPLKLLFMACSALDVQPELDFEKEEEAIFHITENLAIDMEVEDSGSLEGLRRHLDREQYDVVYLSGHAGIDKDKNPYFIMEDEFGNMQMVSPRELWDEALIENPPRLLFLSGCRTGEEGSDESTDAVSFAHLLVEKHNVPAVLGWGRSVKDKQAIHAGKMLFHELSRGKTILEAVQRARYELIKDFTDDNKPAWPLLRFFSSGMPLNSIVAKEQKWKPKVRIMNHVYLKNSQVKVLRDGFVGRRRQLQTGLCALKKDYYKVGLLLLGTGGLGKSCLAGKICERFPDHTLIIIHGRLNTISMEDALTDAFIAAQDEKGQQILSQNKKMSEMTFSHYAESRPNMMELIKRGVEGISPLFFENIPLYTENKKNNFMADVLAQLCAASFKEKKYLLLLDDFEQNMEGAEKGEPGTLMPEAADLLIALLRHLPKSGKMTQLIITSRYAFSLTEQHREMVEERLEKIWLPSFQESEQRKKAQQLENISNYKDQSLTPQLLAAGHGNPRLMEWLDILVGQMKAVELPKLLEAIRDKQEDFVHEHVIRELLNRGGKELELFLWRFSIYRRPVLLEGVELVVGKAGLRDWQELLQKGMGVSLVEHDQARKSFQVTPLLREEWLKNLEDIQSCHEAAFTYYKKVCESRDSIDPILTEEWIFHALDCGEEYVASSQGGKLVDHLRERLSFLEALRIGEWVLAGIRRKLSTYDDSFLLYKLAYALDDMGEYRKAIGYYEKALAILKEVNGDNRQDIATLLNNLGAAWHAIGDHRKTIDYYEQALVIDREISGREHPNVARDLNNLGSAWRSLDNHRKSIEYTEKALDIWKKFYAEGHPQIAAALNNLGAEWNEVGDCRKSINYYEYALSILKDVYGEKHPMIATVFNNLASVYNEMSDHRKAITYLEQALSIDEAVFGQNHPDVAIRLNNLGSAWNSLGDIPKAINYYERAFLIWKEVYGDKHPQIATVLNNLGSAWGSLGDHRKAIDFHEQALSIVKEIYGKKHQDVALAFNNLGSAWNSLGKPRKAIAYFEESLTIWMEVYDEKHPRIAMTYNNLGSACYRAGDFQKTIKYSELALSAWKEIYGENCDKKAAAFNNLGSAWKALGDLHKAAEFFEQTLCILKETYGEKHPKVAGVLNNLGGAFDDLGDHQKAIKCFEQALFILREVYGEKHPQIAITLNNIGESWRLLKDIRKANDYYEQSLFIWKEIGEEKCPEVATTINNLGLIWDEKGEHREAIKYYEEAIIIWKNAYGEKSPQVAIALNNIGHSWCDLGDCRKAIEVLRQALVIDEAIFGLEHPKLVKRLLKLGSTYFKLGEKKQARNYIERANEVLNKAFGPEHPETKKVNELLMVCK